ncbi:MAG: LysR family transcriptional regulator [Bacilli bacterium]|nr:LysR family transcriptional regulator [Bacilli bacterium]
MNINFELYKIFYEVATEGNITRAANKLMISQPAVTKQIKTLEEELGGQLFIRTKRGVILTESGQKIYNHIKQGMICFESAELELSNFKKLETGTIRVGISTTLCRVFLLPILRKFHEEYPNIAIQLFTDASKIMRDGIKEGKIDILFAKERPKEEQGLEFEKIGDLHPCFISSRKYLDTRDIALPLNTINRYHLIFQKYPSTTREKFDEFCKKHNIKIETKIEIASASLLEDFVEIGFGIGLATKEYVDQEMQDRDIVIVKTRPELEPIPFGMFTLKDSIHSFATNKLIEMIRENKKR